MMRRFTMFALVCAAGSVVVVASGGNALRIYSQPSQGTGDVTTAQAVQ